jgi:transcription termination factor Rho
MAEQAIGTYEPMGKSGGFLRSPEANYQVRREDIAVTPQVCLALGLRGGESIKVECDETVGKRPPRISRADSVLSINDNTVGDYLEIKPFDELTAIDPQQRIRFETVGGPFSMRIVDLMTPIGFGQRGLIVAPPRTGKTILLQQMAAGIAANHPDVYMMVLLIDERPEEVTEMRRTVHGEVVASCNDHDIASHVRLATLMIKKAKRMVECGEDVIILLDSLTRVGRAFNAKMRGGGRVMSGGLDISALVEPKAIFGAARNVEHGGSLTIIASCLIETGSRMDDVIFNEFKGTGNMEMVLSREMANRRLWPAIDLNSSGTRKEELLLSPDELKVSHHIRRSLHDHGPTRSMEVLLDGIEKHPTNSAFIAHLSGSPRR